METIKTASFEYLIGSRRGKSRRGLYVCARRLSYEIEGCSGDFEDCREARLYCHILTFWRGMNMSDDASVKKDVCYTLEVALEKSIIMEEHAFVITCMPSTG